MRSPLKHEQFPEQVRTERAGSRLSAQSMTGSVVSSSSVTFAELWILPINQVGAGTISSCCVF